MHDPKQILNNVNSLIAELEAKPYKWQKKARIADVCEGLGIFDWWNETISISQLKQMKAFLNTAIKLGYDGYACFKVGAAGCSHGMWANKKQSTTGYSPDGACIFHSFRSGDNYWSYCREDNTWCDKDLTIYELKYFLAKENKTEEGAA